MEKRRRKKMRLTTYDYSKSGIYFITVCTKNHICAFGDITNGKMRLNSAGKMTNKWWLELPVKFSSANIDLFSIMPNHLHGIITIIASNSSTIEENRTSLTEMNTSLPRILQWFKTMTTNEYIKGVKKGVWPSFFVKLWQRSYYDHIIRNERELKNIREYILNNPLKWNLDRENPKSSNFNIDQERHFRIICEE